MGCPLMTQVQVRRMEGGWGLGGVGLMLAVYSRHDDASIRAGSFLEGQADQLMRPVRECRLLGPVQGRDIRHSASREKCSLFGRYSEFVKLLE